MSTDTPIPNLVHRLYSLLPATPHISVEVFGLKRLLLFPQNAPFSVTGSMALNMTKLYWLSEGMYGKKGTVLGEPDWGLVNQQGHLR
jgi:hypothetical protein